MMAAIGRLITITLGVLTLTFFAVFFVRHIGARQTFQTPPHTWFSQSNWTIVAPADPCAVGSPPERSGTIVLLEAERRSGAWVANCAGASKALHEVLATVATPDILLKIHANEVTDLDKLVDIANKSVGKRFALWAPAQKVARHLRKEAPQWLFAADTASLLRLHLFSSLGIEPAIDFWPDFVIASDNRTDGSRLSPREAKELQRRQKRVLWNGSTSNDAPYAVDGLLTTRGPGLRK